MEKCIRLVYYYLPARFTNHMACREPLQQFITAKEKLIEKGYRFPDPFNMDCDEKVSEKKNKVEASTISQ